VRGSEKVPKHGHGRRLSAIGYKGVVLQATHMMQQGASPSEEYASPSMAQEQEKRSSSSGDGSVHGVDDARNGQSVVRLGVGAVARDSASVAGPSEFEGYRSQAALALSSEE